MEINTQIDNMSIGIKETFAKFSITITREPDATYTISYKKKNEWQVHYILRTENILREWRTPNGVKRYIKTHLKHLTGVDEK